MTQAALLNKRRPTSFLDRFRRRGSGQPASPTPPKKPPASSNIPAGGDSSTIDFSRPLPKQAEAAPPSTPPAEANRVQTPAPPAESKPPAAPTTLFRTEELPQPAESFAKEPPPREGSLADQMQKIAAAFDAKPASTPNADKEVSPLLIKSMVASKQHAHLALFGQGRSEDSPSRQAGIRLGYTSHVKEAFYEQVQEKVGDKMVTKGGIDPSKPDFGMSRQGRTLLLMAASDPKSPLHGHIAPKPQEGFDARQAMVEMVTMPRDENSDRHQAAMKGHQTAQMVGGWLSVVTRTDGATDPITSDPKKALEIYDKAVDEHGKKYVDHMVMTIYAASELNHNAKDPKVTLQTSDKFGKALVEENFKYQEKESGGLADLKGQVAHTGSILARVGKKLFGKDGIKPAVPRIEFLFPDVAFKLDDLLPTKGFVT